MDSHRLLAFIAVATVLLITPGVDMALVTKNAVRYGRRSAFCTALGIYTGVVIWAVAAAVGIAGLLRASALAFTALKLLGASYLFFLGIQALWLSFRNKNNVGHLLADGAVMQAALPSLAAGRAFRQGILSNLFNPKIATFFTSFLPQFVAPSGSVLRQTLLLGGIHFVMSMIWLLSFAAVASQAATVLRRPRLKAALDRLTACVLIAFGVRLATEQR